MLTLPVPWPSSFLVLPLETLSDYLRNPAPIGALTPSPWWRKECSAFGKKLQERIPTINIEFTIATPNLQRFCKVKGKMFGKLHLLVVHSGAYPRASR